jgi:hypothetical protein
VSLSQYSSDGTALTPGTATATPSIVATPSGGVSPYTYSWTYDSGDTSIYVTSSTSSTGQFNRYSAVSTSYSGQWKVTVTDNVGQTAVSSLVYITFDFT